MADDLLIFHAKLYVGTKNLVPFTVNDPPLAFATPFGEDKAYLKRKDTVDHWCGKPEASVRRKNPDGSWATDANGYGVWDQKKWKANGPHIIDNVLIEGFTVDKSVERYSTSNKLFRINDPRGFQLEISTENLCEILLNGSIINGVFQGKFLWGRLGGTNFLTRENHSAYLHHLRPAIDREFQPGDHVHLGQNQNVYHYLGKFYQYDLGCIYTHQDPPESKLRYAGYHGGRNNLPKNTPYNQVSRYKRLVEKKAAKPSYVFMEVKNTSDYGGSVGSFHILKSPPKVVKILTENNQPPVPFTLGAIHEDSYRDPKAFFETKAELDAFAPTFKEKLAFFADEHEKVNRQDYRNLEYTDYILDQSGPVEGEGDYRYW